MHAHRRDSAYSKPHSLRSWVPVGSCDHDLRGFRLEWRFVSIGDIWLGYRSDYGAAEQAARYVRDYFIGIQRICSDAKLEQFNLQAWSGR